MTMGWSVVFDGFLVCVAENIHVALNRRYQECYSFLYKSIGYGYEASR